MSYHVNSYKLLDLIEVKSRKTFWCYLFYGKNPSFRHPLTIQLSLNHTIALTVTVEDRRFKPYMSQGKTIGGANQLSYKAFGQLQIIHISEHSNTLVPKSLSPTSISCYPSINNRLLLDFCYQWTNTFVDCNIEIKDFVRWCDIFRLKVIHSFCNDYKHILFQMRIFYTT